MIIPNINGKIQKMATKPPTSPYVFLWKWSGSGEPRWPWTLGPAEKSGLRPRRWPSAHWRVAVGVEISSIALVVPPGRFEKEWIYAQLGPEFWRKINFFFRRMGLDGLGVKYHGIWNNKSCFLLGEELVGLIYQTSPAKWQMLPL